MLQQYRDIECGDLEHGEALPLAGLHVGLLIVLPFAGLTALEGLDRLPPEGERGSVEQGLPPSLSGNEPQGVEVKSTSRPPP